VHPKFERPIYEIAEVAGQHINSFDAKNADQKNTVIPQKIIITSPRSSANTTSSALSLSMKCDCLWLEIQFIATFSQSKVEVAFLQKIVATI